MTLDTARILLAVFDGARPGEPSLDGLDSSPRQLRATLDLAFANGLYYPLVRRLLESRVHLPHSEDARWEAERSSARRYRATLELLRSASEENGIRYTVIKNASSVEQVPRDVDIFVREETRGRFLDDLTRRGLRLQYDDESEISISGDGLLRIDVYSQIHYLHQDFLAPDYLEASRTSGHAFGVEYPTLNAEASFLLNSVHTVLGHAAMTLLDYVDLRNLTRRMGGTAAARTVADAQGWGPLLDRWTARLDEIDRRVSDHRRLVFPARHGQRFVLDCAVALAGAPLSGAARRALRLSLLWDDIVYATEGAGLDELVRRSAVASGFANLVGHRLRSLRGDRKRTGSDPGRE